MKELKVKITFTEEVLGSQCADKEIHRTYIASKVSTSELSCLPLSIQIRSAVRLVHLSAYLCTPQACSPTLRAYLRTGC